MEVHLSDGSVDTPKCKQNGKHSNEWTEPVQICAQFAQLVCELQLAHC